MWIKPGGGIRFKSNNSSCISSGSITLHSGGWCDYNVVGKIEEQTAETADADSCSPWQVKGFSQLWPPECAGSTLILPALFITPASCGWFIQVSWQLPTLPLTTAEWPLEWEEEEHRTVMVDADSDWPVLLDSRVADKHRAIWVTAVVTSFKHLISNSDFSK